MQSGLEVGGFVALLVLFGTTRCAGPGPEPGIRHGGLADDALGAQIRNLPMRLDCLSKTFACELWMYGLGLGLGPIAGPIHYVSSTYQESSP